MKVCLICGSPFEPFISFGQMPIANGFLDPSQYKDEYFFKLEVGFCPKCKMVQLIEQPDREKMFNENYAFYSSTSTRMATHFKKFAALVINDYLKSSNPFVVEIGSNDGIMLQHFTNKGIRHLGIEPSANVAQVAIDKGINTISEFFDEHVAKAIVAKYGQVDAFLGANVMCHIPYLHSVVEGIRILLKPDGIVMFEDPYMGDIIEKTSYDQIYDEHVFYFSINSISNLFEQHGLEVIATIPQNVHGGSMRYIIAHKGAKNISDVVLYLKEKEKSLGLHKSETYEKLAQSIEQARDQLIELLQDISQKGKRVVGYGATSKSTTVVNYCGITSELIEFISDTTPIKQGKYSPGAHIPIQPYDNFKKNYPNYALLFAWNHAEEIMAKEQNFQQAGGKWIVYVPKVKVLE